MVIFLMMRVIFPGTPTSELLPDLKEFPEPPLDLTSDSVPVEDPTKSKCCAFLNKLCVGVSALVGQAYRIKLGVIRLFMRSL